ncbi:hypothetical protein [Umezakia ovalisporum]|uniref:hypothetical protein n=1 Tax=Umezakia ovalisporum TaxID=75695 RepID=UPI0035BBCA58
MVVILINTSLKVHRTTSSSSSAPKPSFIRESGRQICCFLQGLLTIVADLNGKGI